MIIIEVVCPNCRHATKVAPSTLLVDVTAPQTDSECHASVYWICELCADLVAIGLNWAAWLAVTKAGASIVDGDAEAARPLRPETAVGGLPLTADDLLDLHEELADELWDARDLDDTCAPEPRPR